MILESPDEIGGILKNVVAKRKLCFPLAVGDQGRPYNPFSRAIALPLQFPSPLPSPLRGEDTAEGYQLLLNFLSSSSLVSLIIVGLPWGQIWGESHLLSLLTISPISSSLKL